MKNDETVFTAEQVAVRLRQKTEEILKELQADATEVVIVPILNGALSAAMRVIAFIEESYSGCSPCMGGVIISTRPIRITRSSGTKLIAPALTEFKWSEKDFAGKFVIIIDDLVDEGETLKLAYGKLKKFNPSHLYSLVLVKKSCIDTSPYLTHCCFKMKLTAEEARTHWLYGCGMDINGEGRNKKAIYCRIVKP